MLSSGVTMYFKRGRMRFRHRTIMELDKPNYLHLRINERKKQLFIQSCDKDKDAFPMEYGADLGIDENRCYINAKNFLHYLAHVVGVQEDSDTLWFPGALMNDGKTVYVDLTNYAPVHEVEYE